VFFEGESIAGSTEFALLVGMAEELSKLRDSRGNDWKGTRVAGLNCCVFEKECKYLYQQMGKERRASANERV
jgi:hypothetical protein